MSEMIERVARAIFPDCWNDEWINSLGVYTWEDFEVDRDRARTKARAAIEAMREPTDEMLSAAGTRRPVDDEVMGPDHPWALWDSMTDAALNGNT
jgi:hypothetical protein